jgi:adenine-specific DNA-methyltransferase
MITNKEKLGQFFTKSEFLLTDIVNLIKYKGRCLEPSVGAGHIIEKIEKNKILFNEIICIELDEKINQICKNKVIHQNFLEYNKYEKFDCIIGNPPYVGFKFFKDNEWLSESLVSGSNLYNYFIEKLVIYHMKNKSEMILILPKEFFNVTKGKNLREYMFKNGTITDVIDYDEQKVFEDANINTVIIRYEKGNMSHSTKYIRRNIKTKEVDIKIKIEYLLKSSYIFCVNKLSDQKTYLSDIFNVMVGLVSGANEIFKVSNNNFKYTIDILTTKFKETNLKEKYIYCDNYSLNDIRNEDEELYKYIYSKKEYLKSRRIKKFNDDNFYHWGAIRNKQEMLDTKTYCIYVSCKTRQKNPFIVAKSGYFDGSVLCLKPKKKMTVKKIKEICEILNSKIDFEEYNMLVNGRYSFGQKTLSDILLEWSK